MARSADPPVEDPTTRAPAIEVPWQRLDARVIWVDIAQTLLSLSPLAVATFGFGVDVVADGAWPLIGIAAFGALGAVADAWRWTFTRYRITADHVERHTGLFVRRHRSLRRDRIRSVDVHARLRHRVAGLRVVEVGAGQRAAAGEAALALDAIRTDHAQRLHHALLRTSPVADVDTDAAGRPEPEAAADASPASRDASDQERTQVFARFRPGWVIYNLFSIWAYLMALGLLWGAQWLGSSVGFDLAGTLVGLRDWSEFGWVWLVLLGLVAVGAFGVIGMGVNYFTTYWNFELARLPGNGGTQLRTRHGLFTTREVHRDDARLRGVQVAEPVLWRWMGVADTTVITTGLDEWSMAQPTAVLPRGPVATARRVATRVLDADDDPIAAPLRRHPRAALRRRMWWATLVTAAVTAGLGWLAVTDVVPAVAVWAGAASWPLTLGSAVIAYRALGHTIHGEHLVVRSGLMSRATAVLQRSAVSTIAIRESLLQQRLGLRTVSAMTSAGYGVYEAPDINADDALAFADAAAPGLLAPFLLPAPDGTSDSTTDDRR